MKKHEVLIETLKLLGLDNQKEFVSKGGTVTKKGLVAIYNKTNSNIKNNNERN